MTKKDISLTVRQAIKAERSLKSADVTILFAIRRPGCANCREYGVALDQLSQEDPRVCVVGAVKETGVADAELLRFYEEYFRKPIYLDEKWNLFHAMGGKKLSWPQLIRGYLRSEKRYKRKGIANKKFGGDLYTQGGVLIFDRKGRLRFALAEEYGYELDVDAIKEAISEIRETSVGSSRRSTRSSSLECETERDWSLSEW